MCQNIMNSVTETDLEGKYYADETFYPLKDAYPACVIILVVCEE